MRVTLDPHWSPALSECGSETRASERILSEHGMVHLFECPQCMTTDVYQAVDARWRSWP